MTHRVGVTGGAGTVSATVFDIPGCSVEAPDTDSLLQLLPISISEYLGWLGRHGESRTERTARFEVVEEIDPRTSNAADGEFCFEDDLAEATDEDMETAIRWMGHARADLTTLVDGLSDAVLDWRPPKSAMARIDPWKPKPLTIREIMDDIAGSEGYYRTGLEDGRSPALSGDALGLAAQRARTLERLHGLTPEERRRVFRPSRPWQDGSETWTVRKVLRRIISHERFHTAEIEQRLTWLLLGVPDFTAPRS